MGAAEFEWGIIPQTLSEICKNQKYYKVQSYIIGGKSVHIYAPPWRELPELLKNLYSGEQRTKEWTGFRESLSGEKSGKKIIGWLELDNNFFFFKEKDAFDKLVDLIEDHK